LLLKDQSGDGQWCLEDSLKVKCETIGDSLHVSRNYRVRPPGF